MVAAVINLFAIRMDYAGKALPDGRAAWRIGVFVSKGE